mmetsp:Transcript_20539/g.36935  ORF Transcript_20539/g.36935 Transcript_20539/m.36935 type:complete len:112 (+) Transcript_20539:115-450(+)|eukprot:CAMPEP_0197630934 /NCGR_PEP_ID=MMETSP1338-20131121/8267_1 /TAXON_ID=43686 ORGANISM="Pelagodinium beii, Strain RCC1491" /NCGR_SAMPLE_ID=MMETSP1338 /ASSEMBLY_ACC=CAM_ASM_000754 /LENGTH=111 /DNA_ID=CAMNT_0043202279 /DNA_START=107 /DNA_END=442 /DNA_ORIENTATION=+
MALAAATAMRTMARRAPTAVRGVRQMSAGVSQEEAVKTMNLWKYIGFGGVGVVVLGIAKEFTSTEEHHHKTVTYAHERNRVKSYPWACGDCDFFDLHCWNKCKEEKAAESE